VCVTAATVGGITSGAAAGSVALAWGPLSPGGVEGGVARGRRLHVMVFPLWFFCAQPYFYLLIYLFIYLLVAFGFSYGRRMAI
ncbi:hypothetical protein P3371_24415, partial [Vibrio parahaemolyticus]|nr:hypothetical protein [Vibrio parahaemolyticus]